MLTLVTGLPGSYKTAFALSRCIEVAEQGSRPFLAYNVRDLNRSCAQTGDGADWASTPVGSIVLIDEAQRVFRVRPQGSAVPAHVAALETHRHSGHDLWLVTQHPLLIDTAVRKLCGRHYHLTRRFGMRKAVLRQWERCVDPTSTKDMAEAQVKSFVPKAEVFTWYKSTEMDTTQRDFPWMRVGLLGAAVLGTLWACWSAYTHIRGTGDLAKGLIHAPEVSPATARSAAGSDSVRSRELWSSAVRSPRVAGVPRSAPLFDSLGAVKSQPVVAGCMRLDMGAAVSCECQSAQGTLLDLPLERCLKFVRAGEFDETRKPVDVKELNVAYLNARDAMGSSVAARSEGGPQETPAGSGVAASSGDKQGS